MTASTEDPRSALDLTGRRAIVTGAGMGIGRAIAHRLAMSGCAVVVADADQDAALETAKDLDERRLEAQAVRVDVSRADEVRAMVDAAVAWKGGVDILVNNAGIFPTVPVLEMEETDFDRVIAVNLKGVYLCSRAAAVRMIAQGRGGRIINVTSIDALHPSSVGLAHYDASKHGVWGFTKNLARELAPHGIWVNAVAPGGILTPGVSHIQSGPGVDPESMMSAFLTKIPMGRLGEADEIAKVVLFLGSDLATYMTGSQVIVDGGALLT